MKDFLFSKSWFDEKYEKLGHHRHNTFKVALNLFLQYGGSNIVETGCTSHLDWGSGQSTIILAEFCKKYGGTLDTVDLSESNIEKCKKLTSNYAEQIRYHVNDSVKFLKDFQYKIDLLYLDSYDYPYGELLDVYGGKVDINKAISILDNMSEDDIVKLHNNIIFGSQNHCINELMAALPRTHDKTLILIDDCKLAGGGKGRIAKDWLLKNNYLCLLDQYQSLWIKKI